MRHPLIATCIAALALGVGASTAVAAPPSEVKLVPEVMNFGSVAVGNEIVKPLTILNRTNATLYYAGANWPNLAHPELAFPDGIWNRSFDPFPCWEIPAKSSCTLYFGFRAAATGRFESAFDMRYSDDGGTTYYSNPVPMVGMGR